MFIMLGQGMIIKVLAKLSENSSHDSSSDRQEIAQTEAVTGKKGRIL